MTEKKYTEEDFRREREKRDTLERLVLAITRVGGDFRFTAELRHMQLETLLDMCARNGIEIIFQVKTNYTR